MSTLSDALFVTAPKELDYLAKTYCKETGYLTLDDLKQKHKEYMFTTIRMLRRTLETQLYNINKVGIMAFQHCSQLLSICLEYYKNLSAVDSIETLKENCSVLQEAYQHTLDNLRSSLDSINYSLYSDMDTNCISNISWTNLAQKAARHISVKGHHLNVLIPYPKEDFAYIGYYNAILQNLFLESERQFYSFYTDELNSSLFANGQYLHTSKERTNMRTKSFDAVIVTHDNMFNSLRPRINTAASYLKKDGTLILFGLSSDFTKLDLRRIASVVQDIHVYSYTAQAGNMLQNDEICVIIGRSKDPQSPSEFNKLMDIFATHQFTEDPVTMYGSGQDERPLFASYDITQAEAIALTSDMRNATQKILSNLLPKSIEDTRRPLLPFSSGQLGLVLISGEINGIVQEKDTNCCHVVKGSSSQREDEKTETLATNDAGMPTRIRTTKSVYAATNVNIVLPTGQFVELH